MATRCYFIMVLCACLMAGNHTYAQQKTTKKKEQIKNLADQKSANNTEPDEPYMTRRERKRLHREEKRKEREERKKQEEQKKKQPSKPKKNTASTLPKLPNEIAQPKKRKQEILYPTSRIKTKYRINVLIPLYLDELVKGESVTFKDRVPDKAAQGIAFYEGLKLAADSLKKAGYNLDIYINDVGSFSESPEMLINNRKFDSTDLIIGAVQQHDIPELAAFAKKKRINFVSALSPNDGYVKNNQYFTMLQPTLKSHCEYIIDDMSKKYTGQKVALLYRTNDPNDENAGRYLANDSYSEVEFNKLLCNIMPNKETLLSVFDTSRPNIIVAAILDASAADSLLKLLARYFPRTHFEVYGMPTWNSMPNLKKSNAYPNVTVNITYPFNFELKDGNLAEHIDRAYRKEYGSKMSEMAFRGYEALCWYAYLLQKYGTIFNGDYKDNSGAPFTKFEVKPRWDGNGSLLFNENRNIYLSTYQAGAYKTE